MAHRIEPGMRRIIAVGSGQPPYSISILAAWDQIRPTDEALEAVQTARAICFGTLAQRTKPSRSTIREIVLATSHDGLRVLDMNVRLPFFSPT